MGQKFVGGYAYFLGISIACGLVAQESPDQHGPSADARRAATAEPSAKSRAPSAVDARRRIEAALDRPLRAPIEATARPLSDVLTIVSHDYDIPILFDTAALDAVAVSPDVELNLQIANVSLRSALELVLRRAAPELTYIIDNEVLLVTSEEEAASRLEAKVYRVDDLVCEDRSYSPHDADFDSLIHIIVATVEPDSWMERGTGEGEIHPFSPGVLVVSQTHRVHDQIDRLLDELRAARAAVEAERAASIEASANRPVTRAFRLRDQDATAPENRERLRSALQASVDWEAEGDFDADEVFLDVFQNQVLVRHLPRVVHQVELVVREIGSSGSRPGMAGGGSANTPRRSASQQQSGRGSSNDAGSRHGGF